MGGGFSVFYLIPLKISNYLRKYFPNMFDNKNISNKTPDGNIRRLLLTNRRLSRRRAQQESAAGTKQKETKGTGKSPVQFKEVYL